MLDPESERYARQISESLPIPTNAMVFNQSGILPFSGIRIFSEGEAAIQSVEWVRQAFQSANIPFSTEHFQPSASPAAPPVAVFIFVGHK